MIPVISPRPALWRKTAGESERLAKTMDPNRTSTVTLVTSETTVVTNVPCLRVAKVATVSADPQQRATTIASKMPVRSTSSTRF